MLQRNDYDFRNQRKILVLEMFEILGSQTLTKILLHSVINMFLLIFQHFLDFIAKEYVDGMYIFHLSLILYTE